MLHFLTTPIKTQNMTQLALMSCMHILHVFHVLLVPLCRHVVPARLGEGKFVEHLEDAMEPGVEGWATYREHQAVQENSIEEDSQPRSLVTHNESHQRENHLKNS